MKTKLFKKWRREANERIGVFRIEETNQYSIVFCKSAWGFVSDWVPGETYGHQILEEGVEALEEAKKMCDHYRRVFILREARKEWNKKNYGSKQRYY